jgi:hypothetical protein
MSAGYATTVPWRIACTTAGVTKASIETNPYDGAPVETVAAPVARVEHQEDLLTRMIEQQAAKIPSHLFLLAACLAMGGSVAAELRGQQRASRFVGMWVAPLLTMGVYNKMVKMLGGPR